MRWEYKRINVEITDVPGGDFEGVLNALGDDGWELVSAIDHQRHGFSKVIHFIFKRPIAEGAPLAWSRSGAIER